MDTGVYDALKEKLGDTKIKIGEEEKSLIDIVVDWEDGVVKTRTANKDLTGQRDTWEKREKEFKTAVEQLETAKNSLQAQLDDLQKKGSSGKEKETELQKQINALNDQVKSLKETSEAADKRARDMEDKANKANETASVKGLREKIINGLSKYKIVGERADLAIEAIMAKGFAKLVKDDETGLYSESFCTLKDSKQLAADCEVMCKWFADTNQYLVEGSGMPGTGNQHNSVGPPKSGGKRNYMSMISNRS